MSIPDEFLIPDHPWAPADISADAASDPSHSFAPTFSGSSNGSSGDSSNGSSNPSDATSRGQFDDAPGNDDDDDDETGSHRDVRGYFHVHTFVDDVVITSSNSSSEDANSVSSTVPYLGNDAVDSSEDSGVDGSHAGNGEAFLAGYRDGSLGSSKSFSVVFILFQSSYFCSRR